ncbi:MAG: cytochrome c1 [Sphingomicrobium sp.]
MIRVFGFLVGIVFAGVLLISLIGGVASYIAEPPAELASDVFHKEHKELQLASNGPFGTFDTQQLQRGFQVYSEVCSACHGLHMVAFRDLERLGYNEAETKKIAADWKIPVPAINEQTGEASTRKAIPSDTFPNPFANEVAARAANNNAYPPDLSLITKAREGGAAYIYSLITGYASQAGYKNEDGRVLLNEFPDAKTPPNLHFNPYFANLNIAMPPPLTSNGQVTYAPGNPPPTVDQMAKDVSAFLVWAAEPNMAKRHAAGIAVVIFLLFATILGYLAYSQLWAQAKRKVAPIGPLDPENKARRNRASAKAGISN